MLFLFTAAQAAEKRNLVACSADYQFTAAQAAEKPLPGY